MAQTPRLTLLRFTVDLTIILALVAWSVWGWRSGHPGFWAFFGRSGPIVLAFLWGQQLGFRRGVADRLADLARSV